MIYNEFKELGQSSKWDIWLREEKMDIGGGKISRNDIDKLKSYEKYDRVMISGLCQDTFEYFIAEYGASLKYVSFFKNKFIEDLSSLETCTNLFYVSFFHNQRAEKLWNMTKNVNLLGINISDFTRLHYLNGVETAPNLQYLAFGDAIWNTSCLHDIDVLRSCNLKSFDFSGKAIENIDLQIFADMPELEYLDFRTNLFTTEDIAHLIASRPELKGYALRPYVKFERNDDDDKDILIVGKRKPFLNSKKDELKIKKYVMDFENLITQYRSKLNVK